MMSAATPANQYGSLEEEEEIPGETSLARKSPMTSSQSEEDEDLRCGYCSWKPECLQRMNNAKSLLAVICWFVFIQSFVVNGMVNVNIATLERRFHLSGSQVAWIASSYELTAAVLSFIVGYLGTFLHKPKMLTVAAAVMAVGSFTMLLPHVIVEPYTLGTAILDVCDAGNSTAHCGEEEPGLSKYLFVFIFGQMITAVSAVTVYAVGTPMIDESIDSKNSPVYIGLMHGISAFGPAVGFLFGGAMLHIYVDVDKVDMSTIEVTPEDPRWVGAWWIGFAVASGAAVSVSLLMACFARELPETSIHRAARVSEAYAGLGIEETKGEDFGRSFGDFLTSVKIIFCNPTWVFMTLGATVEAGLVQAIITFLPQALQFQFAMTPGTAALIAGALVVPAAAIGQILGGFIPKWFDLRTRGMIIQSIIGCGVTLLLSFCLFIHCDNQMIAGVTVEYMNTSYAATGLSHDCNSGCDCHTMSYEPVCGVDGVQYFSACHAGCVEYYQDQDGDMMYSNCSCISSGDTTLNITATEGICHQDCNAIKIFMPFLFLICIGTFIAHTAFASLTMRIVPLKQRAFATGLQGTIIRFLGPTPFPLIFGLMIDKVCLVWQESCYDDSSSCWIYDSDTFGLQIMYLALAAKSISTASLIVALLVYKPPKQPTGDDVIECVQMGTKGLPEGQDGGMNGDAPSSMFEYDNIRLVDNDELDSNSHNNNYSQRTPDISVDKY